MKKTILVVEDRYDMGYWLRQVSESLEERHKVVTISEGTLRERLERDGLEGVSGVVFLTSLHGMQDLAEKVSEKCGEFLKVVLITGEKLPGIIVISKRWFTQTIVAKEFGAS